MLNDDASYFNLGRLYEQGEGVKQDYSIAIEYYEKAAKLNNSASFNQLGYIYSNGLGVKQDYSKAAA
ncbi:hypothetical protein M9Y10_029754 [Tritrichomonas musculus]|uniref:Beta-lactamase n=1 Tax=Tritrichomonas musculus TaxID=1915356 RepID=A0ABR2KP33_9EUKA